MKKFSVEGVSNASLEAAMANAMTKASLQGAGTTSLSLSVASATKDDEDIFHVIVNVVAMDGEENEPTEDDDDEGGSAAGGRGRANARMRRRAERLSQELKDELLHQFRHLHLGNPGPDNMADAYSDGFHTVMNASPDMAGYESMADQYESQHADNGPDMDLGPENESPSFDVVQEAGETVSSTPDDGGRIGVNVMAREVDEVIGLLSMGFYEPPRPAGAVQEPEVTLTGGEEDPRRQNEPDPREIPPPPAPDRDQPAPTA